MIFISTSCIWGAILEDIGSLFIKSTIAGGREYSLHYFNLDNTLKFSEEKNNQNNLKYFLNK